MPPKPNKSLITGGKYLALATALPGYVLAGLAVGAFAEHFLHWPILLGIGVILGTFLGLTQLIRELLRDEKRAEKAKDQAK